MTTRTTDIVETLTLLMEVSDPEGPTYQKLERLRATAARGVVLGPKSMRYIHQLIQRTDNIECAHVRRDGLCSRPGKGVCPHRKLYRQCHLFEAARPSLRGSPLGPLGG